MERFIIGFRVKGKVSEKFSIFAIQTPSHITLKDNIYTDNIKPIEALIEKFVKETNFEGAEVEIGGIGNFRQRVFFLDVKLNDRTKTIYLKFFKILKEIDWLQWDEFDLPDRNFHLTITIRAKPEQIEDIENYLNQFEKEKFTLPFDNITILKKLENEDDHKWIIEKEFSTLKIL